MGLDFGGWAQDGEGGLWISWYSRETSAITTYLSPARLHLQPLSAFSLISFHISRAPQCALIEFCTGTLPLSFILSTPVSSFYHVPPLRASPLWETPLNIKSKSILLSRSCCCGTITFRVEEFVSQLLNYLDASGGKLNRALTEHVSPSVISQDGSRCQLIHLSSLALVSTTAEGRRNKVDFLHHKVIFEWNTHFSPNIWESVIKRARFWKTLFVKHLTLILNSLWGCRGDLYIKE